MWLYDLHLLVERLSREDLLAFVALARSKEVSAICAAGIRRAADTFATRTAVELLCVLETADGSTHAE
ncbi:hypothetical protein RTF48_25145, partial [Escherichia coli]|uniref:hypothetical protein n=1 Tax=Escherichia coli TaxID=562 RepID=UPI0028E4D653